MIAEIAYFDSKGDRIGNIIVDEKIFGDKIKKRLLHQVIVAYEANKRVGTASTKTRAEVKYAKRKLYRQKKTGFARAGSAGSHKRRHGGVAHGPKPRDYRQHLTKNMRRAALNSALLGKLLDKEIFVIRSLPETDKPKTKIFYQLLKKIGLQRSTLIGLDGYNKKAYLCVRNLPNIYMLPIQDFNAYDLLRCKNLLLTLEALEKMVKDRGGVIKEETFAGV